MARAIVQVVLNAVALFLASRIVPGIDYAGGVLYLLLAGLVFGLINLVVKPIVTLLSLPLIVLTLGLFYLVVNALMLWMLDLFMARFEVDGFVPALLGGLVIALFNWVVRAFFTD
jgi:putative membrane protein